ncbi:MAG: hypothetical protein DRR08_20485 [Candidatus Parabeggiatoa sp. nov. 2]|nr:MAG: hypothetical protein B6247_13840 [Beggiatoa sp. 4572_84]RKZ56896.1 MAG: hypothetical protein DRR08_20485 [Gammaproteobacteria bacterium]
MEEKESQKELAKIIQDSLTEFHGAMKLRDEFAIRIGRRTTQIIRFSMTGMSILAFAMIFLLGTFYQHMDQMASDMKDMRTNFQSVATDMKDMKTNFQSVATDMKAMKLSVDSMNQHISVMPVMNTAVSGMSENVLKMTEDMAKMSQNMALMQKSMSTMSLDVANMSYQFTGLNGYVGSMGYNVNRMAAPMKMFPFP